MAWSSWPSSTHNSGDLDDNEYEKLAVQYSASGVIGSPLDTPIAYGDSSGMQVKTHSGRYVFVRGRLGYSGATDTACSVASNSSGSTRTDLLVAGIDRGSNYNVTAYVKTGPASTQVDVGTTGKYEIPLATIRVINGATTITAEDVLPAAWFCGPLPIVCKSANRPPHAVGLRIYETDTKNRLISDGSAWSSEIADTGWVGFTPASGWNVGPAGSLGCKIRARGGFASLICEVSRVGSLAADADSIVATLDTQYRPGSGAGLGAPLIAWVNGEIGRGVIKPSGQLILTNSPAIASGGLVVFQSATWPIG